MEFVRDAWYAAGWSREIGRAPAPRTVLGENLVLWRTTAGAVAALRDLCPHRLLPLSKGAVVGDHVRCGYHGLTFDGGGRCVKAPTQRSVPRDAQVASYPVAESMGLVWVWMGEAERADPGRLYELPQYGDPAWGVAHGDALHIRASYLLLCDNLSDPTHVTYVHPTTLGSPVVEDVPVTFEIREWGVTTTRWTPASAPVGFFKAFGNFSGLVDRWQRYHMRAPSTAIINFGSAVAGTGAGPGAENRGGDGRVQIFSCHFLTPVNERETIDYWLHVRNFAPGDPAVGEGISEQFRIAFAEDKLVLEAIQVEEDAGLRVPRVGLELDASAGLFRRMVAQRIRAEAMSKAAE
jgi:vanillate O-demethylase monooxygenase subunit